jgi:Family of unknown function (DUF6328)
VADDRRVKTALDETRLLILGAQILFGFHLNAAFQAGFSRLSEGAHLLYAGAFSSITVAVGLLITPSMQHLLVEQGRSTQRILRASTWFAGLSLLLIAPSLGSDLAIVMGYRFGTIIGATAGILSAALALFLWYGVAWMLRMPGREGGIVETLTSIDVRVEHMLTEARVLLPGAQALFGFQMAILLTDAFAELPAASKVLHAAALCCIALAIILLMSPAAFHRIAFGGQNSERYYRIGARFVIASAIPLAIGITFDLHVALARALDSLVAGALIATAIGLVLTFLWFIQPLLIRATDRRKPERWFARSR